MRTISAAEISDAVRALCIGSNRILPDDMRRGLAAAQKDELWPTAAGVLDDIIENYRRAERLEMPVCQDTGMACVFVELGQEVHIDGSLEEAIQEGVRRGYLDGYLRKSVVSDPIERINTLDNTPAVITYDVVMGDRLTITVAPKGAGSENMGRLAMLKPSDGLAGVKRFVLDAVEAAGPNPCPPHRGGGRNRRKFRPGCPAGQTGASAADRPAQSQPGICRTRDGTAGLHQCARHRTAGLRRKSHCSGSEY